MQHFITHSLQRLDPPLSGDERITFYLAVAGPSANTFVKHHGFGIVIDVSSRNDIDNIKSRSSSALSSHMRGSLGGTLTILEWLSFNATANAKITLYTKEEYVYKHLKPRIKKWLMEPDRENIDLIRKIDPLLDRFKRIEIDRAANCLFPGNIETASELATEARDAANI